MSGVFIASIILTTIDRPRRVCFEENSMLKQNKVPAWNGCPCLKVGNRAGETIAPDHRVLDNADYRGRITSCLRIQIRKPLDNSRWASLASTRRRRLSSTTTSLALTTVPYGVTTYTMAIGFVAMNQRKSRRISSSTISRISQK